MTSESNLPYIIAQFVGAFLLVWMLTRFLRKKFDKTKGGKNAIIYSSLISIGLIGVITYFTMGFIKSVVLYLPGIFFWFIYDMVKFKRKEGKTAKAAEPEEKPTKKVIGRYWTLAGGILIGVIAVFALFIVLGATEEKKDKEAKETQTKKIENFCQDAYYVKNKLAEIDPARRKEYLTEKGDGLFFSGSEAFILIPEMKEAVDKSRNDCFNMFGAGTDIFDTESKINALSSAASRFDGNEKIMASQIISEIRNMHADLKIMCDLTGDVYRQAERVKSSTDYCKEKWYSGCNDNTDSERQKLQDLKDKFRGEEEAFQNISDRVDDLLTQMSGIHFNEAWGY